PRAGRATCDCASTRSISSTSAEAEPAIASSAAADRASRLRAPVLRTRLRLFIARLLPWDELPIVSRTDRGARFFQPRKRTGAAFLRHRTDNQRDAARGRAPSLSAGAP